MFDFILLGYQADEYKNKNRIVKSSKWIPKIMPHKYRAGYC